MTVARYKLKSSGSETYLLYASHSAEKKKEKKKSYYAIPLPRKNVLFISVTSVIDPFCNTSQKWNLVSALFRFVLFKQNNRTYFKHFAFHTFLFVSQFEELD